MKDKRLINRLSKYWEKLRKERPVPPWERFNPGAVGDVWQQCCVCRVEGSEKLPIYTYDFVGLSVRQALGVDATGYVFNRHFRGFPGARIVSRMDELLHHLHPLTDESQFVNNKNKVVKYRSCLLPFGNKERVTHILLGLSWASF